MTITQLESPVACTGNEGNFLLEADTEFNAPCEPSH
jgi:hypothetical protein